MPDDFMLRLHSLKFLAQIVNLDLVLPNVEGATYVATAEARDAVKKRFDQLAEGCAERDNYLFNAGRHREHERGLAAARAELEQAEQALTDAVSAGAEPKALNKSEKARNALAAKVEELSAAVRLNAPQVQLLRKAAEAALEALYRQAVTDAFHENERKKAQAQEEMLGYIGLPLTALHRATLAAPLLSPSGMIARTGTSAVSGALALPRPEPTADVEPAEAVNP